MTQIELRDALVATPHGNGSLWDHGRRVADLLSSWDLCATTVLAGLYHSVYGRQHTKFHPPLTFCERDRLRDLVGVLAERLIFLNCAMTLESFWRRLHYGEGALEPRCQLTENPGELHVATSEIDALLHISVANMLDHNVAQNFYSGFKWPELSLVIQYESLLNSKARHHLLDALGFSSI